MLDVLIAYKHKDMFGGFTRDPGTLHRRDVRGGEL
jgi:hypothetical protein